MIWADLKYSHVLQKGNFTHIHTERERKKEEIEQRGI